MQINSFNHFRALAILIIIAGHTYPVVGMTFDSLFNMTLGNLITGGTSLFVFISGFLFHHIFYPRYQFGHFLGKKVQNVLIPYTLLSAGPIILYSVVVPRGWNGGFFLPEGEGMINQYLIPALKYYATGSFLTAYWYIPFIMLTFLLSPLHVAYIRLSGRSQLSLIAGFSLVSLLMHRPDGNLNVFQNVIYFTPVYLIGITSSMYKEKIYACLRGKEIFLLAAAVLLAYYQARLGDSGNYHKAPLVFDGIDLMYLQKLALCFFFLIWLNRFEEYNNHTLHTIAATSFTAFFIHPFILFFLERLNLYALKLNSWMELMVFTIAIASACIALAKAVKVILPKHSRYLTGY